MKWKNQGGSVRSFILIGVVLVLLFIGGAYLIRQATLPAAPDNTPVAPGRSTDDTDTSATPPPSTDEKTAADSPAPTATQLPQTGPAELAGTLFVLAILSATSVSYLQSRRLRITL